MKNGQEIQKQKKKNISSPQILFFPPRFYVDTSIYIICMCVHKQKDPFKKKWLNVRVQTTRKLKKKKT